MSDIAAGYTFVDGEKGITASKLNNIVAGAVIQPSFVTGQPASSTLDPTDNLLEVKSGGTYARITGSQLISSVGSQVDVTSQITAVRLRSFSAVGNGTFEVAQRNCGTALSNPAQDTMLEDRWAAGNNGSLNPLFQRILVSPIGAGAGVVVPGTNYAITTALERITAQTQKTSLAATDLVYLQQRIEGPAFRELMNDVHSVSLLVRSSVANLKFGLSLRDPSASRSLTKLCTLGAASTITLITLPNLPLWPSAGTFTAAVGANAYNLAIAVAAGSTFTSPANDTWQNGNFIGALGQDNLLATASATFEVFFVQHEPGSQCTTLLDVPFGQNLDGPMGCTRYFQKTYDYATKPGTVTGNGAMSP